MRAGGYRRTAEWTCGLLPQRSTKSAPVETTRSESDVVSRWVARGSGRGEEADVCERPECWERFDDLTTGLALLFNGRPRVVSALRKRSPGTSLK